MNAIRDRSNLWNDLCTQLFLFILLTCLYFSDTFILLENEGDGSLRAKTIFLDILLLDQIFISIGLAYFIFLDIIWRYLIIISIGIAYYFFYTLLSYSRFLYIIIIFHIFIHPKALPYYIG